VLTHVFACTMTTTCEGKRTENGNFAEECVEEAKDAVVVVPQEEPLNEATRLLGQTKDAVSRL